MLLLFSPDWSDCCCVRSGCESRCIVNPNPLRRAPVQTASQRINRLLIRKWGRWSWGPKKKLSPSRSPSSPSHPDFCYKTRGGLVPHPRPLPFSPCHRGYPPAARRSWCFASSPMLWPSSAPSPARAAHHGPLRPPNTRRHPNNNHRSFRRQRPLGSRDHSAYSANG